MFVAQLSSDANTNLQIISNFKQATEGGALELGRFVDPLSFTGLDSIRTAERFQAAERKFEAPALRLEELATAITLGRHGESFTFPPQDNAIFIPMIGISDVVDSLDDLSLKPQNYAQVAIDPAWSNARFVARFLNSEFGKEIREFSKTGFIPKLNKQTLKGPRVFVPNLQTQKTMMEIEARIAAEQNTLFGLQNEIGELRRELWSNPRSAPNVDQRLAALSSRLSGSLKQHAVAGFSINGLKRCHSPLWMAISRTWSTKWRQTAADSQGTANMVTASPNRRGIVGFSRGWLDPPPCGSGR